MLGRSMGRGLFIGVATMAAVGLALAVYQVPQPLRGAVIIWLLVGAPLLAFVLRVLRHAAQLKAASPRPNPEPRPRVVVKSRQRSQEPQDLRVIVSNSVGSGRYTIR